MFKIGIIGCGYMAKKHLGVLKRMSQVQIKSILTTKRSEKIGYELSKEYEIENFVDINDFLNSDIDVVAICSPNRMHFEHTIKALERDKNTFCEKPLSYYEEEILKIQELAEKRNKKVCVGMNCRFRNQYNYFQSFIDKLGKIFFMKGTYLYYAKEDILRSNKKWLDEEPQEKEIFLHSGGIHCLDLLNWYGGIPQKVYALTSNESLKGKSGRNYTYSVLIEYKNGTKAELFISSTLIRNNDFHIEIYGTDGSIIGTKYYINEGSQIIEKEHQINQTKIDLELQWENFFEAIEKNKEPLNNLSNALLNAKVCNAAEKSILEKKSIEIK